MAPQQRNNFIKLVTLIIDIACNVIWKYIRERILGPDTFETFLNKEKHKLVHIYETSQCCQCVSEKIKRGRHISRTQFLKLYTRLDDSKQNRDHKKYIGEKLTQICICNYTAKVNINVKVLDVTLANYIIQKSGICDQGIDSWIEQIKNVRNELFHLSDIQELTDDMFGRRWKTLEGSILGIAQVIGKVYSVEVTKWIRKTEMLSTIPDYKLKYEKICRDYWINKCAEFERAQMQDIEKKEAILNCQAGEVVRNYRKVTRSIQTINSMVDNVNILINIFASEENVKKFELAETIEKDMQRIHVPVFLQLDLPKDWDRSKMFEALDGMRLSGTPDQNIIIQAISTDDLNIAAKISDTLLRDVNELRSEVNILMESLLSEAAIGTTKNAKVGIDLKIPDKTDFPFDEKLRQIIKFKESAGHVFDCVIINGELVFADNTNNNLLVYNKDGNHNRTIQLSKTPYGISVINDNDLTVSYNQPYIEVINIATGQVKHKFETNGLTSGISFQNGLVYAVIDGSKLSTVDVAGNEEKIDLRTKIHWSNFTPFTDDNRLVSIVCIATDKEKLFLVEEQRVKSELYCCNSDGLLKWTFSHLRFPCRVTSDGYGYVYLTYNYDNKVCVVSPDGKHHKEVLTEKDGLQYPTGIYYDKSNDYLLVSNGRNRMAFLYDVNHLNKDQ